jgi:protein ImuB
MWNSALRTETGCPAAMWLGLQFPDLGLEVHAADDEQATVLLDDQRVVALNRSAAAAGILCGSTLATARSICAEIQVFRRDRERERERLQNLAEAMYGFSSLVSLELPDGLTLEVGGSRQLYCDLTQLAQQASHLARSLGHRANVQLGPTPTAALVLARSNATRLAEVPLALAGLPNSQVQQLASMGIRQLGPLLTLPERELGQRFGSDLVRFLGRLNGRRPDPREGIRLRPEFIRRLHMLDPLRDKNALQQPMQKLLSELEHWLIARQLTAGELHWQFAAQSSLNCTERPQNSVTMKVAFGAGRQRKNAFLPITLLRLDQIELPDDVITIGLKARVLSSVDISNRGLFTGPEMGAAADGCAGTLAGKLKEDLIELQDELRARLGEDSCYNISSVSEHVPERAWRINVDRKTSGRKRKGLHNSKSTVTDFADAPAAFTLPRPAWLFKTPRAIPRSQLTLLQGPERIQTAWWDLAVQRDYYLARHSSGARCWVFVDAEDHWFLHGYFA